MDDDAATAFRQGVEHANDSVRVANSCRWLVDYYLDHGRTNDAEKLAMMAADVYSFRGLETAAHLMERMGRLAEAEVYLNNAAERYDDKKILLGFYIRQDAAAPNGPYARKRRSLESEVFPDGLQRVTLRDFNAPPKDGCIINSTNDRLTRWGLNKGDVIVALDGFRVHTDGEYSIVRHLDADPKMTLIVWHDGKYQEFQLELFDRYLGVEMAAYKR